MKRYKLYLFSQNQLENSSYLENCFNEIGNFTGIKVASTTDEPDFLVVFVWPKDIVNIYTLRSLFRNLHEKVTKEGLEQYKPIIITSTLLGLEDILKLEIDRSQPEMFNQIVNKITSKYPFTTSIFNPNIWIRFIDWSLISSFLPKILKEFTYFKERMYHRNNATEYLELFLRIQNENWLDRGSSSHGGYVYPFVYSNECQKRENIMKDKDFNFLFTDDKNEKTGDYQIKGIKLRILLIDDKIEDEFTCKAVLIKNLLELNLDDEMGDTVYWRTPRNQKNKEEVKAENAIVNEETVNIFQLNCTRGCRNCMFVTKEKDKTIYQSLYDAIKSLKNENIQLVAVNNLDQARIMLADKDLRFDLIMMDYLLEKKRDKDGNELDEREYATEFWGNGKEKFFELSSEAKIDEKYIFIKEIYDRIKSNRGPMHKLWIFPITAFNQTFIDDLRNKEVRLIDYYWYLSRGADPVNTPYLFIYSLNKFLKLQLENAIFSEDEILGFLKKSKNGLDRIELFEEFNAYMGAEYTVFVEKYMTRPVIFKDMKAGSLFSDYVWKNFYAKDKYYKLFRLTNHIHKFYHRCAFGTRADFGKMILFWRELMIFVYEEYPGEMNDLHLLKFYKKLIEIEPKK